MRNSCASRSCNSATRSGNDPLPRIGTPADRTVRGRFPVGRKTPVRHAADRKMPAVKRTERKNAAHRRRSAGGKDTEHGSQDRRTSPRSARKSPCRNARDRLAVRVARPCRRPAAPRAAPHRPPPQGARIARHPNPSDRKKGGRTAATAPLLRFGSRPYSSTNFACTWYWSLIVRNSNVSISSATASAASIIPAARIIVLAA